MKKVIPPFLFLFCIVLMICSTVLLPGQYFLKTPLTYIGILPLILGLFMTIRVRRILDKADTEIHTFKSPRRLVYSGLFRISRNPIYLGFTISLLGVFVLTGSMVSIVGVLLFFFTADMWYIPYEEDLMEKQFGKDYILYKSNVRRWL